MSQFSDISTFSNNSNPIVSFADLNLEETFKLIDRTLLIESCIHHQVLPLAIEDGYLILGMLNPQNNSTLEEICPLLSSFGYYCKTKAIEPKLFQLAIAEYLKYHCHPQQKYTEGNADRLSYNQQSSQPKKKVNRLHDKATLIVDPLEPEKKEETGKSDSIELLIALPPQQLWQELFARMLNGGIGRLHFEASSNYGRILLSQDGVPQLSLDNIDRYVYQKLIAEVKNIAKLSNSPLQAPKKVAVERYSGNERLLLRIKLNPGQYGEESTIQVLRGKALALYEQTHTDKLTEQALDLARQLKKALKYLRNNDSSDRVYLELLSNLKEVQIEINRQLQK
jgi:type II secretory ATPase GspE/PulE/Tfp pilus assembly ATPase PilB-like protein